MAKWDVRALRMFNAQEADQLSFRFGELLTVIGPGINENWYEAQNSTGETGMVPVNLVKEVPGFYSGPRGSPHSSNVDDDFDDDVSTAQTPLPPPPMPHKRYTKNRQSVPKFDGNKKSMKIYDWIVLYEHNIDDCERVEKLGGYLRGTKALTWYTQEIVPNHSKFTWSDCKQRMLKCFGTNSSRPIIAAIQQEFLKGDSVRNYYSEKMALLNQTNLLDIDKIALLTYGMPKSYQHSLTPMDISTPDQWQISACMLENLYKDNMPRNIGSMVFFEKSDTESDDHSRNSTK